MGAETKIEWADHTFNPWIGCTKITPACDGCYAAELAERYGWAKWGNHPRHRTAESTWAQPLAWDRKAAREGKRPFVFCASLADVFDNQVDEAWRLDLFRLIEATPNLVWLLLTKRPQNIVKMVKAMRFMPPNIAFGTTVEDRERVEANLPWLMLAAGLRPLFLFASCEPLLEDLGDLRPWLAHDPQTQVGAHWEKGIKLREDGWPVLPALGWVIAGGESGAGARPMYPQWARSLREQCAEHGTPFLFKQWGEWHPFGEPLADGKINLLSKGKRPEAWRDDGPLVRVGKQHAGRTLDGATHDARPPLPSMGRVAA